MKQTWTSVFRGLILIAWMCVIYYFSDQANSNEMTHRVFGPLNYFLRKGAHSAEYAILFWLSLWFQSAFAGNALLERITGLNKPVRRLILPLVFSSFYAGTDELHQLFVPGRSALFSDVIIDSCGAGSAALISFFAGRLAKH